MKRSILGLVIACAILFQFNSEAVSAAAPRITPNNTIVLINGVAFEVGVYNIDGYNYFKLRDLAEIMVNDPNAFNVGYDAKQRVVQLMPNERYMDIENNYMEPKGTPNKVVYQETKLNIHNKIIPFKTYVINDNNYFKLRDLATFFSVEVGYDQATKHISLISPPVAGAYRLPYDGLGSTNEKAVKHPISGDPIHEYVFVDDHNQLNTVEVRDSIYVPPTADFPGMVGEDTLIIKTLNENYEVIAEKTVPFELPMFGTFFSGKDFHYIAYGQMNDQEENIEVIRIVKYDKDFNRVGHTSIYGDEAYTAIPFEAATGGRMAELDDRLVFHTSRTRYRTTDGFRHQSQLTIHVNTTTMKVTNSLAPFQENFVGHSLNQFVLMDEQRKEPAYLDHGDYQPRAVVLTKGNLPERYMRELYLMHMGGGHGNPVTGVSISGFEQSTKNYLAAFNSVNQEDPNLTDDYGSYAVDLNRRSVFVYATDKNADYYTLQESLVKTEIANYYDTDLYTTTPTLVKVAANHFVVFWQAYDTAKKQWLPTNYVYLDGDGKIISEVKQLHSFFKLSEAQPIVHNKKIIWVTTMQYNKYLFEVPVELPSK